MRISFRLCIKRLLAFFIDSIILGFFFLVFCIPQGVGICIMWLYFAGFEASSFQATVGKWWFGLSVRALDGSQASFIQTTVRFLGKDLSAFILYGSYLFIFCTKKRQSLHDMISGCVIEHKKPLLKK